MDRAYRVVFDCPHWKAPGNVGHLRAKRMVSWLASAGYFVSVIHAGKRSRVTISTDFGEVITVADPLKIWGDYSDDFFLARLDDFNVDLLEPKSSSQNRYSQKQRKANSFRRTLAYHLFIPDLTRPWAERVIRDRNVLRASENALWFLSSSPPESAHLAAQKLAQRTKGNFIMDMRDGWLDEPMKELLRSSKIHNWREKRLERKCVESAKSIIVTSDCWGELLTGRYSEIKTKTCTILNAVPGEDRIAALKGDNLKAEAPKFSPLHMLHAGRFSSSRPERNIDDLLEPILNYVKRSAHIPLTLTLMGTLEPDEQQKVNIWKHRFAAADTNVNRVSQVPHEAALHLYADADLLLLLSSSKCSIPAKFYDYLVSGKPILAATIPDSAMWVLADKIPQVYLLDITKSDESAQRIAQILDEIKVGKVSAQIPIELKPEHMRNDFLKLFSMPSET